jgi:hypothetical protein
MEERLVDYLFGLLPPQEARALEEELKANPELRQELNELQETLYQLPRALPQVPPPPGSWIKIRRRLRPWNPQVLGLVASLALLILLGLHTLTTEQTLQTQNRVVRWAANPKTKLYHLIDERGKPRGMIFWSPGRCLVVMKEAPPQGARYRIWGSMGGNRRVTLGEFQGTVFEVPDSGFKVMGVSLVGHGAIEPLGEVVFGIVGGWIPPTSKNTSGPSLTI